MTKNYKIIFIMKHDEIQPGPVINLFTVEQLPDSCVCLEKIKNVANLKC